MSVDNLDHLNRLAFRVWSHDFDSLQPTLDMATLRNRLCTTRRQQYRAVARAKLTLWNLHSPKQRDTVIDCLSFTLIRIECFKFGDSANRDSLGQPDIFFNDRVIYRYSSLTGARFRLCSL
jgi:hypothetical protein